MKFPTPKVPLLVLGMASLLGGVWGGMIRLPVNLPIPGQNANWITFHGPLMVCGFLGTLIGLERAVGLRAWWTFLAPLLTGAGGVLLLAGLVNAFAPALVTAGSAVFVLVTLRVVQLQPVLFTTVMAMAAILWCAGNALWLAGWAFPRVVPWWTAFLALTIVGERLDLARFQRPTAAARPLFYGALGLFLGGVILSAAQPRCGETLIGAGLVALAAWLGSFDLARKTIKNPGLPRFMAVCLLVGYGWMAVAGGLLLRFAPVESGYAYDAVLHAFFLGFVFSMIFGHAPVIFPAVLGVPIQFHWSFYLQVILLHSGLVLRVVADLEEWSQGRRIGGMINATAIAGFLLATLSAVALQVWRTRRPRVARRTAR